jgi:DNA-binding transcriptional LysR family regulator
VELHHLRYVLKLAERLHFSQAAADLRITQPSLSQQIILLEKELGVRLFERKTRSVELTTAGEEFVAYAATVMKNWHRLEEAMRQRAKTNSGYLRIGTLVNMSTLDLSRHLQAFQNQYANISLNIVELIGSGELLRLLEADGIDLAFAIPTPETKIAPRFAAALLIPGRVVSALPAGHPLAARPAVTLQELAGEKLIFPARAHSLYTQLLGAFRQAGLEPRIVGTNSQVKTGIDMAATGFGVTLLTSFFAAAVLRPDVVLIPVEPAIPRDMVMAYGQKIAGTFALNTFVQYFAAAYTDRQPSYLSNFDESKQEFPQN